MEMWPRVKNCDAFVTAFTCDLRWYLALSHGSSWVMKSSIASGAWLIDDDIGIAFVPIPLADGGASSPSPLFPSSLSSSWHDRSMSNHLAVVLRWMQVAEFVMGIWCRNLPSSLISLTTTPDVDEFRFLQSPASSLWISLWIGTGCNEGATPIRN